MIHAVVNSRLEARVPLLARGPGGEEAELDTVIDTGFNGFLTISPSVASGLELPLIGRTRALLANGREIVLDLYEIDILWDGRWRAVEADVADTDPLIGMALLHGHSLYVEAIEGGRLTIEALP